jgi:hypothetical protein
VNKLKNHKIRLKLLGILSKLRQEMEERMWSKLITVFSILML